MRKFQYFRDKDFIETQEGYIMCVIGNVHPHDRVICYLKYIPGLREGVRRKWSKLGTAYTRILPHYSAMGYKNVLEFLEQNQPEYIVYDEVFNTKMIQVPKQKVKEHYVPELRLREILSNPEDELEKEAQELVNIILDRAGISSNYMGITGSILLKMHNLQFSDIDLVVYGRENALRVREALLELYREGNVVKRPDEKLLQEWAEEIAKIHPLTINEAKLLYIHRWNRGVFRHRVFSLHPVRLEDEVREKYGDKKFRFVGLAKIKAKVIDDTESIFLPAIYKVDDVKVIEGPNITKIEEIVCYEGLYNNLAKIGDVVYAYGKIEEVEDRSGYRYYRLVIGSVEAQGKDYLKPKWLIENI